MITWTAHGDGYEGVPGGYRLLAKIDDDTGQIAYYVVYQDGNRLGTAFSVEKAKTLAEQHAADSAEGQR
jgi:hypothetical protein